MWSLKTNVAAINAYNNLWATQNAVNKSISRLSSGYRISSAMDDAAGLGISVNLEAQIRSLNQASRNAADGLSATTTAESALNGLHDMLIRVRELAMESSSAGIGNTERSYLQTEANALTQEITRISNATEFNGKVLLNRTGTALTFQVGIRNVASNDRITVSTVDMRAAALGVSSINISTSNAATTALTTLDTAIDRVSAARATFGAAANRFTGAISQIQVASENLAAANARIRDADVAQESSLLTRNQLMLNAGVLAMLQANQSGSLALRLLSGFGSNG